MKKKVSAILQYLFFAALGIFFVWLSLKDINHGNWLRIKDAVAHARKWIIIPVIIMLVLSHYSRAIRWKILMEPLGYHPTTFNAFAAVMIGYLVNSGVPRLGEVVKCTLLSRYEKLRADRLIGTIVVERAFDVLCLFIVFVISIILQGNIFGDYLREKFLVFFQNRTGDLSATKIILTLAVLTAGLLLLYFVLKRFGHINAIARVKIVLLGIWHGLNSIRNIRKKGWFLFHSLLIWLMYLGSTTLGILALRETAHLGLGAGLVTLAVGSVGMILTPGGIGAYPILVAELMGLYHVDPDTIGTALGWLLWSAQTAIVLVGGLVCLALVGAYNRNRVQAPIVSSNESTTP